jgi:SNF family Na+-dependent transporter
VKEQRSREQWGSRIGVILAVAGSAVGLGNFLRFPGTAAQNGGGAFMLPYFISLLILGIPMCWAEWTMGRYAGARGCNSAPAIFTVIWRHPLAKYFGGLALVIPLVIYMYYVLIESWCLGYAFAYMLGDPTLGENPTGFFRKFVGIEQNGVIYQEGSGHGTWLLILVFVFNFVLIYRGVSKGIETFCKIAMPLMLVLGIIVLVRVLTLGTPDPAKPDQNVLGGLNFMWDPKPEALLNPATWLAASGQIFFSLSVGFGIIINYASYLSKKDDVALSGLTSCSMNEFFEVCLGGLITIPAAFIFLGLAAGLQIFPAVEHGDIVGRQQTPCFPAESLRNQVSRFGYLRLEGVGQSVEARERRDALRLGDRQLRIEQRDAAGGFLVPASHLDVRLCVGNQRERLSFAARTRCRRHGDHRQHRQCRFVHAPIVLHPAAVAVHKVDSFGTVQRTAAA